MFTRTEHSTVVKESYSYGFWAQLPPHEWGEKNLTYTAWTINTIIFNILKNSKWNQLAQLSGAKEVKTVVLVLSGMWTNLKGKSLKQQVKI